MSSGQGKRDGGRPKARSASLGGNRMTVLEALVECGMLTVRQIERYTGIENDPARKPVYHAVEALQAAGLATSVREFADLLDGPRTGKEAGLRWGRTAKVYLPTRQAVDLLYRLERYDRPERHIHELREGTKAIIPHEVEVRDVRVRLREWTDQYPGHRVTGWLDGEDARLPGIVPDARVTYDAAARGRICAVEVDRGTERGMERWDAKRQAYASLLSQPEWERLTVLVIAPDPRRALALCEKIGSGPGSGRYLVTDRAAFGGALPSTHAWRVPGSDGYHPFLAREYL